MLKIPMIENLSQLRGVFRVIDIDQIHNEWQSYQNLLVKIDTKEDLELFKILQASGLENIYPVFNHDGIQDYSIASVTITNQPLQNNDVVSIDGDRGSIFVLLRQTDLHHSLFLTNQCNNYCLMCSQPPTKHDDSWLVKQAIDIIDHINFNPKTIGITGGEPLLIGDKLLPIIQALQNKIPNIKIELLSNGRLLSEPSFQTNVLARLNKPIYWLIPLYGHAEELHDFIVQSHHAFEETIEGLYVLQKYKQPVQLRIVLVKPVLENLLNICQYIRSNLPFVNQVAFIGCEPIGFALANTEISKVDITDWWEILEESIANINLVKIHPVIMNIPLCCLPQSLWKYSSRSISDWKQVYHHECQQCDVVEQCCGLFSWYQKGWMPSQIKTIKVRDNNNE